MPDSPDTGYQHHVEILRFPVTIPSLPFVFPSGVPHGRDHRRDRELLAELAAGRPEALAELYDRHSASLFRHAIVLTRRRPDAEDLVQGVFMKLAKTGANLLRVRTPESYLHGMLRSAWIDSRRRALAGDAAVESSLTEWLGPQPASPEDALDVARALHELPAAQREVIVLHVVEGFSFREVGRMTGVSLFTAAARYRLAVRRLRKTLGRFGGEST